LTQPRNQIDRFALQLFPEMLIPPEFPALVPSQQSDDVVLNAGAGQVRDGEMAEIMDAQSIDACKLRHSSKPLPKNPMRTVF